MTRSLALLARIVAGLLVSLLVLPAYGQPVGLELLDESEFWIRGTSSVNTFTCTVDSVRGEGPMPAGRASVSAAAFTAEGAARLAVPVERFDCGKEQMSKDLKETLGADDHPTIRFRLHEVEKTISPDTVGGWTRVTALGYLTVSGTERLVRVSARGREVSDGMFRLQGCKPITMTYFGVEPPTKFLGLVKVHDRIEVHFDLLARAGSASPSPGGLETDTNDNSQISGTDFPPCNDE